MSDRPKYFDDWSEEPLTRKEIQHTEFNQNKYPQDRIATHTELPYNPFYTMEYALREIKKEVHLVLLEKNWYGKKLEERKSRHKTIPEIPSLIKRPSIQIALDETKKGGISSFPPNIANGDHTYESLNELLYPVLEGNAANSSSFESGTMKIHERTEKTSTIHHEVDGLESEWEKLLGKCSPVLKKTYTSKEKKFQRPKRIASGTHLTQEMIQKILAEKKQGQIK